jgi:hypothetical protein
MFGSELMPPEYPFGHFFACRLAQILATFYPENTHPVAYLRWARTTHAPSPGLFSYQSPSKSLFWFF